MQHLEAPSTMRRIENTKKLSLHKETLRTLSGAQLNQVAGAGFGRVIVGTFTCDTACVIIVDPDGPQSKQGLGVGCGTFQTIHPTWTIDPAPEIPVIVGMP
jgi:hypothetical protein